MWEVHRTEEKNRLKDTAIVRVSREERSSQIKEETMGLKVFQT